MKLEINELSLLISDLIFIEWFLPGCSQRGCWGPPTPCPRSTWLCARWRRCCARRLWRAPRTPLSKTWNKRDEIDSEISLETKFDKVMWNRRKMKCLDRPSKPSIALQLVLSYYNKQAWRLWYFAQECHILFCCVEDCQGGHRGAQTRQPRLWPT